MSKLLSLHELFKGCRFDAEMLVSWLQALIPRSRRNDGRARGLRPAEHDSALGAALNAGVREALESLCRPLGGSWRVDETYIKVRGCWVYLYRAVDARGQTVDLRLSSKRDVAAAKALFRKAFKI